MIDVLEKIYKRYNNSYNKDRYNYEQGKKEVFDLFKRVIIDEKETAKYSFILYKVKELMKE